MLIIIVEKNERLGDNSRRKRYNACVGIIRGLVLYHMPIPPFPQLATLLPKDKIVTGPKVYARQRAELLGGSTEAKKRHYNEEKAEWTVVVDRAGERVTLSGRSSWSSRPAWRDAVIPTLRAVTSSKAISITPPAIPDRTNTRANGAVVIGSNMSAHDICAALWAAGADVTMVQRSSTTLSVEPPDQLATTHSIPENALPRHYH